MWRVFRSAFVRKLAFLLAALLFSFAVGKHAHGQGAVYSWQYYGVDYPTSESIGNAVVSYENGLSPGSCTNGSTNASACDHYSLDHCTPSGAPNASSGTGNCFFDVTPTGGSVELNAVSVSFAAVSGCTGSLCSGSCSATGPTMDVLSAVAANSGGAGGSYCVGGCGYTNGGNTLVIGNGTNQLAGKAVPTGVACGSSNATSSTSGTNCFLSHGSTICVDDSSNTAVVNSDVVPVSAPPPAGQCVAYASGGTMCTVSTTQSPSVPPAAMQTPPGPDNGSPGVPATPTATVQQGSTAVNYYSPQTTSNSSAPVTVGAASGGLPKGSTNANGTGTGTQGTGTGPGDCMDKAGATGTDSNADCTGTLPSLTRSDTVQTNVQGVLSGLMATPLMSGLSGISTNVGTGSCPSNPITIGSWHTTIDFGQTICNIVNTAGLIQTMQTISDACWYMLGILIVMSA